MPRSLTEPDSPTTARLRPPDAGARADAEIDAIRIARLTPAARAGLGQPVADPPALRFITVEPRGPSIHRRAALLLIAGVMTAACLWALIGSGLTGSGATGGTRGAPNAPIRLTPAEQRAASAARAWAAAIAQAKRDRGTDAELQDTIPGVTH